MGRLRLIPNWRSEIRRLWSLRFAGLVGALSGVILVWPALAESIPFWAYAAGGVTASVLFYVLRLVKQPGVDE